MKLEAGSAQSHEELEKDELQVQLFDSACPSFTKRPTQFASRRSTQSASNN